MSRAKRNKKKQEMQFESQIKYKGMTKKEIAEAKKTERSLWVGIRPASFKDRRSDIKDKETMKELRNYKSYC